MTEDIYRDIYGSQLRIHPQFEKALTEVEKCIPHELRNTTQINLDCVRQLMVLCWLRGHSAAKWEEK